MGLLLVPRTDDSAEEVNLLDSPTRESCPLVISEYPVRVRCSWLARALIRHDIQQLFMAVCGTYVHMGVYAISDII